MEQTYHPWENHCKLEIIQNVILYNFYNARYSVKKAYSPFLNKCKLEIEQNINYDTGLLEQKHKVMTGAPKQVVALFHCLFHLPATKHHAIVSCTSHLAAALHTGQQLFQRLIFKFIYTSIFPPLLPMLAVDCISCHTHIISENQRQTCQSHFIFIITELGVFSSRF